MCVNILQRNEGRRAAFTISPKKSRVGGSPAAASPAPASPTMAPEPAGATEGHLEESKASAGSTSSHHLAADEQKTDLPTSTESKFESATEQPDFGPAAESTSISSNELGASLTTTAAAATTPPPPTTTTPLKSDSDSDPSDEDMSW